MDKSRIEKKMKLIETQEEIKLLLESKSKQDLAKACRLFQVTSKLIGELYLDGTEPENE